MLALSSFQFSFAASRCYLGVWHIVCWAGILRVVQVSGPGNRPSGNVLKILNRRAPNHSIPLEGPASYVTLIVMFQRQGNMGKAL